MSTGLFAETDGAGNVVWVWRKGAADRVAVPIRNPSAHWAELDTARIHGAGREAVSEWFRKSSPRSRQDL